MSATDELQVIPVETQQHDSGDIEHAKVLVVIDYKGKVTSFEGHANRYSFENDADPFYNEFGVLAGFVPTGTRLTVDFVGDVIERLVKHG